MMTPEEISEHLRRLERMREMSDAERAERLSRLEQALATDPPEELAQRLRPRITCYQPPRPLTRQGEIGRRFTGDHERFWPYTCGTDATESFPGDYWHLCAHSALLKIASALHDQPGVAVTTMSGRELHDLDFGGDDVGYSIGTGPLGEATGTCTCPHDCAWSGLLREMWLKGGHVVCPGCLEAWSGPGHLPAGVRMAPAPDEQLFSIAGLRGSHDLGLDGDPCSTVPVRANVGDIHR